MAGNMNLEESTWEQYLELWMRTYGGKERSKNWVLGAFTFRRRGNTEKPVN